MGYNVLTTSDTSDEDSNATAFLLSAINTIVLIFASIIKTFQYIKVHSKFNFLVKMIISVFSELFPFLVFFFCGLELLDFFSLQNTSKIYRLKNSLSTRRRRRSPTLVVIIIIIINPPRLERYRSEFLRLEAVDSISEWFVACLLERRLRRPSSRRSCPLRNRPRESSRRSPSYRFESK